MLGPDIIYPSPEAWDQATKVGEKAAQAALKRCVAVILDRPQGSSLIHASAVGAIVEIGRFMRSMAPDGMEDAEAFILAHLRGALRGANGPLMQNGSAMKGVVFSDRADSG